MELNWLSTQEKLHRQVRLGKDCTSDIISKYHLVLRAFWLHFSWFCAHWTTFSATCALNLELSPLFKNFTRWQPVPGITCYFLCYKWIHFHCLSASCETHQWESALMGLIALDQRDINLNLLRWGPGSGSSGCPQRCSHIEKVSWSFTSVLTCHGRAVWKNYTPPGPRTALTSVIPIQFRKEGVTGPGVEMLKKLDLWETVRKALLESLMEVKSTGVLCRVDCSHQQDEEEDLYYCRREKSHSQAFSLESLYNFFSFFLSL